MKYPVTEDGRYFLVKGRLWRCSDPTIPPTERDQLVNQLMAARRAVKAASEGSVDMKLARQSVREAKVALGERGPVWWDDGAPDFNRRMAKNTPYASWAAKLDEQ